MGGGRLLPLFLVSLLLAAFSGALATVTGAGAFPPRVLLLAAVVCLIVFLYRARSEIAFLVLRARRVAEPGPATSWLLVAMICLFASLVLERTPIRYDLTSRNLHSLSDASRSVLNAGTEPVELIGVFRETNPLSAQAADLLEVYRTSSRRVRVEMIDPDRRPDKIRELGVTRANLILARIGAITEEVGELNERSVSLAIMRAENPRRVRIGFTIGHGERSIRDGGPEGLGKLSGLLRDSGYTPVVLSLLEEEIDEDLGLLAIIGPRRPFLTPELEKLNGHLERGGRLLFCLEPGVDVGFAEFLKRWGIEPTQAVVHDGGPATLGLGFGPQVVVATEYGAHPIVSRGIGYTVFPGVGPIRLSRSDVWGVNAEILIGTGPFARLVDPGSQGESVEDKPRERRPLAVVQEWEVPGTGEVAGDEAAPEKPFARLLVVGDSDWISGSYLDMLSNRDLAIGSFHWLSRREFLLQIAPLDRRGTPLRVGLGGIRTLVYLLQWVLPAAMIGIGIWIWGRRR